jgi:Ssu72-like protein
MRVSVVCASNMNRSMEAHRVFRLAGMDVRCRTVALCWGCCSHTPRRRWRVQTRHLLRSPPTAWVNT